MTKEEKVAYYLDLASMPEHLPYDTSHWRTELGISDDDIFVRFHISAEKKTETKEKLYSELNQFEFLPYHRMLSPYYVGVDMYKIDGYKNYLPSDMPIEDICRHIGEDFEKYILPELCAVKSYDDFSELRAQKMEQHNGKEMRLLRYYFATQLTALDLIMSDNDSRHIDRLVDIRKDLELSAEDVASHIEWLDICRENSDFTKVDAKELAMSCASEDL